VTRRHNSHGFRSPEIPLEKPPDRTRVLVVGDSMVYGVGVENDETFPAALERLTPTLQVINAGVPAYGGAEELVQLREEIDVWKPDIVIAACFWNDLLGTRPGGYVQFSLQDGELVPKPPEPASRGHPVFTDLEKRHERRMRRYGFIARNSHAYRLLSDRMKILAVMLRGGRSGWLRTYARDGDDADAEADRIPENVWELSLALLGEMERVATSRGARFLVFVVPDQVQVEPDVRVYGLPPYLFELQERVVGWAAREGIPVLDPLEELRRLRQEEGVPQYHPDDRHWNATGHGHAARLLRNDLQRRGWIGPGG
jgi:hypothetical protein